MDQWTDPVGFDKFVHANLPRLVLYVIKLGATLEEAQDAVSDALTAAYRDWSLITAPDAWVRKVATRRYTRDAQRKRKGLQRAASSSVWRPSDAAPDGLDICGEGAARVIRLLRQLPEQQRLVMALIYDGYTIAEAAEIADMPQSTVRSNLRHARNKLRTLISAHGYESPKGGPHDQQ